MNYSSMLLLVLVASLGLLASPGSATPLDDYVNAPDPNYTFEQLKVYKQDGYTLYILNMTSQRWMPDGFCDRPVWWHYLCITVPDQLKQLDSAIIFIDNYFNNQSIPSPTESYLALSSLMAVQTGSIVADIKSVPNMPIVFRDDPIKKSRVENSLLSWTWKQFILTSDPKILVVLPMTKAVVRAMDTVQKFTSVVYPHTNIQSFMVTGGSKRGWTSWLAAVVDKRVKAIAPIVYDYLNLVPNLHHHYRAYGGWSFAFESFWNDNVTRFLDHPNTAAMSRIVDPFVYMDRLTLPKMVVSTSGDEFFLGDDSHYWYQFIQGETHLRIVPNAEHYCIGHEISVMMSIAGFYLSVFTNYPRPQFTWVLQSTPTGGQIVVNTKNQPTTITAYYSKTINSQRRDFRLLAKNQATGGITPQPIMWWADKVKDTGNGTYVAEYLRPATGWLGFFVQLTFPAPSGNSMTFTTEMMIIPDGFPYPDCHDAGCTGTLL